MSSSERGRRGFNRETGDACSTELIRILLLDHVRETPEHIENSLWIWPHKVTIAASAIDAVRLCQHVVPTALMVATDFPGHDGPGIVAKLRAVLPKVPIVALGSNSNSLTPGAALDMGADAYVQRDDLRRPTLHDLLCRIQKSRFELSNPANVPLVAKMPLPWRKSRMTGALICDITGTITQANDCIVRWLEYPDINSLLGKRIWPDLLPSRADWSTWKNVAGDYDAFIHQSASITAKNGQILWMKVEVFAARNLPSHLQIVLLDQTEIALLTGRTGKKQ